MTLNQRVAQLLNESEKLIVENTKQMATLQQGLRFDATKDGLAQLVEIGKMVAIARVERAILLTILAESGDGAVVEKIDTTPEAN